MAMFGQPFGKTEDQLIIVIQEMVKTMNQFDDAVLKAVWEEMKITFEGRHWPLLPEIYRLAYAERYKQQKKPNPNR